MNPSPDPLFPEITPLETRAIKRFEFDRDFFERCHAKAREMEAMNPGGELNTRLQNAMRDLQAADEEVHDDASIVRGARYLGGELMGLPYDLATVPEQEGLKAGVRRLLAAVGNTP